MSDLDRTLLRTGGTLGRASIELLNEAILRGARFTYATARSPDSARKATAGLNLDLPAITYGGTVTADPLTGEPADVRFVGATIVLSALHIADYHSRIAPIMFTFEDGRDWIRWHPAQMSAGAEMYLAQHVGDRRLRPITGSDPIDPSLVHYVAILAARADLEAFRAAAGSSLASTAHFLSDDAGTPGFDWLEFHHPTGTKAEAILRLTAGMGIERLVVFGDNHNDVPMFEIADHSYAVQNAVPELIAIASAVIGDHESDAVARFIADDFRRETG